MDYKVSIIVPIYNVEKFLDKSIRSIVTQTYRNLEVILVDDGSPDNCFFMCDEWEKKDSRIKVFHKENGGVSSARNLGIEKATGDYVCFVDSDDYIDENYIEMFVKEISNNIDIDIVRMLEKENNTIINKEFDQFFEIFENTGDYNSACKQIVKRDLIIKNNIKFNTEIRFAEDMLFSIECLLNANGIKFIKLQGYNCNENENSVSRIIDFTVKLKNIYELSIAYNEVYKLFEKFNINFNSNKLYEETNRYMLEMFEQCNVKYNEFCKMLKNYYKNLDESILKKYNYSKKYKGMKKIYIRLLVKKKINLYFILLKIRKKLK